MRRNLIIDHSRPTLGKEEEEEEEAVLQVLKTGQIAQGPKVKEFEQLLSCYIISVRLGQG